MATVRPYTTRSMQGRCPVSPIVGVKYAPGLEVCNESFNGSTQRGYDCVIFFVALAECSAGWPLSRGHHIATLIAFIGNPAAGVAYDLGDRCLVVCGGVVGFAVQRVGDVDGLAVEQANELSVEAGRAVLTAPQLGGRR